MVTEVKMQPLLAGLVQGGPDQWLFPNINQGELVGMEVAEPYRTWRGRDFQNLCEQVARGEADALVAWRVELLCRYWRLAMLGERLAVRQVTPLLLQLPEVAHNAGWIGAILNHQYLSQNTWRKF